MYASAHKCTSFTCSIHIVKAPSATHPPFPALLFSPSSGPCPPFPLLEASSTEHAATRSQQNEPSHPTMRYKAWLRSPNGFLSLRHPAADADTDQLLVPTLHLQVQSENILSASCSHLLSFCAWKSCSSWSWMSLPTAK